MNKWKLTLLIGGGFSIFSILFSIFEGWNEATLLFLLRISARVAVVLFILAFLASTLIKLENASFTKWLIRNRKYIGVSFALVHTIHLGFILVRHFLYDPGLLTSEPVSRIAGFIAYLFILLMVATSFDVISTKMQTKSWKILHSAGGYYIWLIFFLSYLKRLEKEDNLFYLLFALLVFAFILKIIVKVVKRSKIQKWQIKS